MASRSKRTRADSAILDRLENDSRGAQMPVEREHASLTLNNNLSSIDVQLAGPSCADVTPDICDNSQSETGDCDDDGDAGTEGTRTGSGTDSVPRRDFENLQAVVRQIADQMNWFADKVSEDMAHVDIGQIYFAFGIGGDYRF